MDLQTLIVLIIELIGTIAFSISGAMVGIRRKMDIFGVFGAWRGDRGRRRNDA